MEFLELLKLRTVRARNGQKSKKNKAWWRFATFGYKLATPRRGILRLISLHTISYESGNDIRQMVPVEQAYMNDTLGMRLRLRVEIEDWRLGVPVNFMRVSICNKLTFPRKVPTLYRRVKFYFINPFLGAEVVPYADLGAGTNLKSLPQRQHYETTDSCSLWVEAGRLVLILIYCF